MKMVKCAKCGFENTKDSQFCGNCGFSQKPKEIKQREGKNKKTIFILLGIIMILIVTVVAVVILNKDSKFEDPFEDVDDIIFNDIVNSTREYEHGDSLSSSLEKEFKENKITADEYIIQLAYSIYDYDKLGTKYKDLEIGTPNPTVLFKKAGELSDIISVDTAKYILEKYILSDVVWDVEEDANSSGMSNNTDKDYKVMPLVSNKTNLSKLNRAVLSSNGNFIIYYTTSGSNAITDSDANEIAKVLENVVTSYEKKFGLKFQYNPNLQEGVWGTLTEVLSFGGLPQATTKAQKVLKKYNIDTKYLDTAMPVFIIDTDVENTNALGYYVQDSSLWNGFTKLIIKVFGESDAQMDSILTTYAFPFFVVSSSLDSFDNTKIVLAHELFHHYQQYICGDGSYGDCASGLFTTETTANFAAVQNLDVNKVGTSINNHATWYVSEVSSSIDKVGLEVHGEDSLGYGAFVFASNYDEVVKDGYNHLFQSMKYENPLKYLYDNSGGNYKKSMLLTAERNLTLDYNNKLLIPESDGVIYYPENYIELKNYMEIITIDYSSMQYFYVNPNKFNDKDQIYFTNGQNSPLTLLLFVKEDGKYRCLYTHDLSNEFVINIKEFAYYEEVAFSIVNSSITGQATYITGVNDKLNKNVTVTAKDLGLKTIEDLLDKDSFTCYSVEEDEDWYNVYQIKVGFNSKDKINQMYFKGTYKIKDYEENSLAFGIAQKVVSGLLRTFEQTYKQYFKNVKTIIYEGTDEYSVTFKITKNYYDALTSIVSNDSKDKLEIIKAIQNEGFVCEYKK